MQIVDRPGPPTGWKRRLYRMPIWLYDNNLGALMGQRFVLINHIGRRSGLDRKAVVEVVLRNPEDGAIVVASGFGPKADWYRNLLAHPDVTIQLGRQRMDVRAHPLPKDRAAEVMAAYARQHPSAAKSLSRLMGYETDGSDADFRAVGEQTPMLLLQPRD